MSKRTVLWICAGLLVFTAIFLFLPTRYQITVYSSLYYENCSPFSNSNVQNQCKTIEPPNLIEKNEPYVTAWWNKTQIERSFTEKEVSVQWTSGSENIFIKTGSGLLKILALLIPVVILAGMIWLFIFTLLRAFKLKGTEQIAWICLIIFLFPLGSIIFLIANPHSSK